MFRDWNVVFVPYCTGDVHIGNRITEDFESEYVEQLGNSQCLGLNYSMHMNGYNNTMAALDWALQNYPDVDNLVVAGESAGSLAAQIHSAHIAKMWEIDARGARFSVIPDSYVGVQPEEIPGSVSLSYYGACRNDFNWPDDIAAACDAGTASTTEMTEALMEAEPQGNWLFINSKGDLTQRYFYAVIEDGIEGYPYTNLISEEDFYSNMTAILNAYKAVSSRVTTFYVEGTKHVFLADSNFTAYESDEGLLLGDAINALLSGSSVNSTSITNSSTSASATTQTTANSPSIPSATSTTTTSVTSSTPLAC
ncbi:hypothetical protein PHYBOEH_003031 [Phytophthora boehmeriae]|uniref:Carbohydrate esterase n=1 Tax=Phytophthora boehmeriae TaxID=109152 RepID=A0A8T1WPK0_9STRA|nr:hypothetical protein PHYBOEH_003031 [Phytophthora boehmeriae]